MAGPDRPNRIPICIIYYLIPTYIIDDPSSNIRLSSKKEWSNDGSQSADAEQAKMLNNLLKSLSPADTAKLNQILNDQEATSRVLSTPQAQELLKN